MWSLDTCTPTDFSHQTQPSSTGEGFKLEFAMLVQTEILQLEWCPRGGLREDSDIEVSPDAMQVDGSENGFALRRLGLLGTLTTDGRVAIYEVPHPDSLRKASHLSSSFSGDSHSFCKLICTLSHGKLKPPPASRVSDRPPPL